MVSAKDAPSPQIEQLFQIARSLTVEERAQFLDRECGDNANLRRDVEELLDSADNVGPFDRTLRAAVDVESLSEEFAPRIPDQIGQFKILDVIASGGMGTVYKAEQQQPRRHVAVKVLRCELTSREVLLRFRFESQLLAGLRHPGIAQVFDAGVHDGQGMRLPYFAMELVDGARSITKYAAEHELNVRQRLELFSKVCDAVEHGHQQGVIHRDLKPSNILVGDDGQPRVIDYGVARSTVSELTLASMLTETGQLIGTLHYMSPEQCMGSSERSDTRSDVYSLGVVLFELLSGALPHDLSGVPIFEAAQRVVQEPPAALSSLDAKLRGDLETVVSKALEKESDRRYGTAGELGADVDRYLNGEAILAQPPSTAYQVRVFMRRHKALVAAVACVVLAIVGGLVSTSVALYRAERALKASQSLTQELGSALPMAMRTIRSVVPWAELAPYNGEPEALLDRVAGLLNDELDFPPNSLAEADLRLKVGYGYFHLGRAQEAVHHFKQSGQHSSRGPWHPS